MEMWNGWAFLTSTGPMGPPGLLISWLSVLVGETVGPLPIRTGEVKLGYLLEVFPSRGIILYVSFRFTTTGSWKICAPLCAASVTITFKIIIWRACIVPLQAATPPAIFGLIGGMMIGRVRLINNFEENFRW